MLEGFEHHGAGAFARHETAATLIEGQRGLGGVVDLGKRAQVGETGDADGVDRLLRAARKRHIGVPVADGAHGGADVVGAGGAGGGHIDALAAHAVADGQMTCCDVADHGGHEQRADALGALIVQRVEAVLQLVDAADARTEDAPPRAWDPPGPCRCRTAPWPRRRQRWRTGRSARSGVPPFSTARARWRSKSRTSPATCTSKFRS